MEEKELQIQELNEEIKEINTDYQKIVNENERLKTDISYLEKKLEENEKEFQIEVTEHKTTVDKYQLDYDNSSKEIESLKNLIEQYKEEIVSLNSELDQYENESKVMDKEIKSLKERIKELNIIIENLKIQIKSSESNKPKKEKNINEQFCELYQSFTNKKKCQYEIDMIIGMHLSRQEKNYEKKFNNLVEVQNRLKKRISDLTSQLNMFKYGKKMPSDLEEHKIEIDIDNTNLINLDNKTTQITEIKRDYKCNTFQKYSEKKTRTLSKRIGDNTITTTTQISYKRRKKEGNNQ